MAKKTKDPKDTPEGETASASKSGSVRQSSSKREPSEEGDDAEPKPQKKKKKKRAPVDERPVEADATDATDDDSDSSQNEAIEAAADEDDADSSDALDVAARSELDGDDDGDEEEADQEAVQLGIKKYVLATFFSGGMLLAYLLGRLSHSFWAYMSNRDWFSEALPAAAAIPDDSKLTYATVAGGVIAFFVAIRLYRHERFNGWVNDVAGELAKVKWPEKKEVTSYTITVIAATAMATLYLALLDRLWGFVTSLIYGHGPSS